MKLTGTAWYTDKAAKARCRRTGARKRGRSEETTIATSKAWSIQGHAYDGSGRHKRGLAKGGREPDL